MADIRNDQYLHRPTAGRGAITAQDPLEVLLHSGGQPISGTNRLPVEATLSGSTVELARSGNDVVIGAGVSLVVLGSGGPVELAGVKEIRGVVRRVSGAPLSSLTVNIGWNTGLRFAWESNVPLVIHPTNFSLSRLPVDSDDTKAHSRVLNHLTITNNNEANDITVNYLFMGVC